MGSTEPLSDAVAAAVLGAGVGVGVVLLAGDGSGSGSATSGEPVSEWKESSCVSASVSAMVAVPVECAQTQTSVACRE